MRSNVSCGASGGPSLDIDLPGAARSSRPGSRRRVAIVIAAVVSVVGSGAIAQSASAEGSGAAQSTVVSAVPSKASPNVTNGTVYAISQVGSQILLGGSFTSVQNPGSTTSLTRSRVLAFDATTGAVSTTFAPTLDGTVEAVAPGPTADTAYVGGLFVNVNGVKSKGITLLNTKTGAIVPGFKPPALNGSVYAISTAGAHVLLTGSFTLANASTRNGTASLNPSTGALDSFLSVALLGHHNYNGTSGANGSVGGRALAVNPSGTRAMVIGNFKTANGLPRDQIVMIDLDGATATVDTTWASAEYTAACASNFFDTYMTDVQYSPDGSYFAVTATGGGGFAYNTDGTRALCDTASRWPSTGGGTNATPTWVDYTGNDTLWSVALTGSAVYVGGHQRWLNNANGSDYAAAGAIPRPGLAALDTVSGLPLTWNPGRNPRGAGAYALFVNAAGLYVGSDTDYIGNYSYKRQKVAYFPLTGGAAPASIAVATLPANVYAADGIAPDPGVSAGSLSYRPVNGTKIGSSTAVAGTTINWADTHGAFVVGSTLFYGTSDGSFYRASFDGKTVGTPTAIDPYDDPKWDSVNTGSGQTYQGVKTGFYGEISSVTGAFYANGRMYYTRLNQPGLYWRWFSPDSGAVGALESSSTAFDFSKVQGMFVSGSSLYWASSADGSLHRISISNGVADPATDSVISGPAKDGHNWRAASLFPYGAATFPNQAPTAAATTSCTQLSCSFDGSASSDADGTVASYAWNFGDGSTGTGVKPTHGYAKAGTYGVSLVVTDDRGAASTAWTGQVTVTAPATAVAFVGAAKANALSAAPAVTVPAGVQAGDTELLYVSTATNGVTTALPSGGGWTELTRRINAPLETVVFTRAAPAGDAGSVVSIQLTSSVQVDVQLVVYSGAASPRAATSADANTATHVAPAVSVTAGGSWVVSYWSSRNSTSSTWTTPSTVTARQTGVGTGGGHVDSQTADSGPVASGGYGTVTAGSGSVAGKGDMVSIVLSPTA